MGDLPKDQGPAGPELSDLQRLDWLRLSRAEGVGPRTFRTLINRFGGASAALEALPDLLRQTQRKARVPTIAEAEDEVARAHRHGVRFVAMGELDYPRLLKLIDAAPPIIGLRGSSAIFTRPTVAIVGSRNASAAGMTMAERLAEGLGREHCVVISGLARGIDARAHRASLATGTVAVLAGGHDRIYPADHVDLLNAILEQGAAISEMPMGWEPRGRDFPRRNRIISGLSLGVIVVEAATRSGSLITARFAAEQGRDVFAVPGSPLDPRAEGTNDLIREGATLIGSADHVIAALAPVLGRLDWPPEAQEPVAPNTGLEPLWDELDLDGTGFGEMGAAPIVSSEGAGDMVGGHTPTMSLRDHLLGLLGPTPMHIDDLVRLVQSSAQNVQTVLIELDLEGAIERHKGGLISAALDRPSRSV